jgi:hypothetical protein
VPIKAEINTDTVIFDDSWTKSSGNVMSKQERYEISGMSKVKIVYSQTTNALGGDSIHLFINNSPDYYGTDPKVVIKINQARGENLELYLNNIAGGKYLWFSYEVGVKSDGTPQWQTAVSAEIYPLDENEEVITTSPVEVKNTMTPLEMVDKINGLTAIPNEALTITGNCQYRFANNNLNWLIDRKGKDITTSNITDASSMFLNSKNLKEIPFDINLINNADIR